jgi:hypothetical protein
MVLKVARCGPLIVAAALALLPASHTFSSTSLFLSMPSRSSGGSLPGRAAQAGLNVCGNLLSLRREIPHGANDWGEGSRRRRNGDRVAGGAVFSSAQAEQAPNFECVKNVRDLASVGNSPVKPGRCVLRLLLQEIRHFIPDHAHVLEHPLGETCRFRVRLARLVLQTFVGLSSFLFLVLVLVLLFLYEVTVAAKCILNLDDLHHANNANCPPQCVRRILRAACVGTASEADECVLVDTVKTLVDLRSEQVISVPEILPVAPHMSIVTTVTTCSLPIAHPRPKPTCNRPGVVLPPVFKKGVDGLLTNVLRPVAVSSPLLLLLPPFILSSLSWPCPRNTTAT